MVDWSPLGRVINLEEDTLDSNIYMRAARNTQLVGEYLGRCLAGISKATGLRAEDIHFTGHSLGGQMLGTMAAIFGQFLANSRFSGTDLEVVDGPSHWTGTEDWQAHRTGPRGTRLCGRPHHC